jgi:hypothetical protein
MSLEIKAVLGIAMMLWIIVTAWGLAANQARRRKNGTR